MPKYIYGIDFGTSNSALAILDAERNKVIKLFTEPSILFFPFQAKYSNNPSYFIGNEAIKEYVKSGMKGRFMKSIKKVLPNKGFIDTKIFGKSFRIEELVALLIMNLKTKADEFLGLKVETAVLGRPVVFDENPEKDLLAQFRLEKAANIAGLKHVFFTMEPIGAAFTYERKLKKEELVLVADFGGGTTDFSLIKLRPESIHSKDRSQDMIAKGGIYIGGDSFDADIMWHKGTPHFGKGIKEQTQPGKWIDLPLSYFLNICSWEKMNFLDTIRWKESLKRSYFLTGNDYRIKNLQTLIEKNLGYKLFQAIEFSKITLTNEEKTDFIFKNEGINILETIHINDFENEIIKENIVLIKNYLLNFLALQEIDAKKIDSIFITGGSSNVKAIQNLFSTLFGKEKIVSGDNFNSVAIGLAYSYTLFKEEST